MLEKKFNECLDKIRNGDRGGHKEIYNHYYLKMIFTALKNIYNVTAAEKIATGFMNYILQKIYKIGYIKNPDIWIYNSINRVDTRDIRTMPTAKPVYCKLYEVSGFKRLTMNEQEIVLLGFMYSFSETDIAKITGRSQEEVKKDTSVLQIKYKL